ncbi:MAG: sugar translocase [Oscillospiraceae bacterium]|nr:sugar translocase [Oscillospiraceae bacterium]
MNNKGRVENSIKNSSLGIITQVSNILLGLVVRTFFIYNLDKAYLGVNGLFTNVLTMLSLAEMGVGAAIVYNMYKPIANNDYRQIAKLMNLYKKAYSIIGCIVAAIGICLIPFLKYIIKDNAGIKDLTFIYVLYLANTVSSYFFAYKRSIFSADQRDRVLQLFKLISHIARSALQIAVLIVFKSFTLYLAIQIVLTIIENIVISFFADRCYPFLREYKQEKLTKQERKPIFDNIKALFIYKIGSTALDGTANIIISAFDSVVSVGLLSNYTLITGSVQTLLSQITNALTGSVGNFIAKEKSERHEELLNKITFLNFILYGLVFVGSMAVINPFIALWAGGDYVLDFEIVFIHCLNIYIFGMMNSIWTFRSTMGLFVYGKWRPLISAIVNLVVSIWLAKEIGFIGVLLGTTFTRVVTNVWYDPLIVYKYGLNKKPLRYYLKWLVYLVVCIVDILIVKLFAEFITLTGILAIIVYGVIAIVVFAVSVFALFGRTQELKYFINVVRLMLKKYIKIS